MLALVPALVRCGETLQPALEAEPSPDGLLTWWLYSPVQKERLDAAKPPLDAREGAAVPGANGAWAVHVAPFRFVDLKPVLTATTGTIWASARIESATGGKRRLRGATYCALRVFRDGQQVLNKPEPATPAMDDAEAEIELPKGACELTVGVSPRSGFCGFQLNLYERVGPNGQPIRAIGDRILLPAAAGKTPDTAGAALRALSFGAQEIFVQPGQKVTLLAGFFGSPPAGLEPLSARLLGPDGQPAATAPPPRAAAELAGRGIWQLGHTLPKAMGVAHELTLEVKAGDKLLGSRKCELYSLQGLGRAAQDLDAEIRQRAERAKRPLPHAALAVEELRLYLTKIEEGEERVNNEVGARLLALLESAKRCLNLEEQGRDPHEGRTGYFERAYVSRIDDGVQPYFIHVPTAWASAKAAGKPDRFPLVVFLHGYVPSYDKHRWWDEMPEFNMLFERNNAFAVLPFGRSNTDFQSCGEVDVLDVIAEARRMYPIDEDRIYLYGYSMGGMATYHLAAHHPDLFAAAIVMAGRADSPLQNKQPLTKFHPYKQWLIHADNPISLCENFANIPVRIYHGTHDQFISLDEAKRMAARLTELGCDAKLTVVRGDHFFGFEVMTSEEPLQWLLAQKRKAAPERARMKAYSLKYAKHRPLTVTATTGELTPIEAEWTANGGAAELGRISPNVVQYALNGKVSKPLDEKTLRKTPQCCGPIRDAICGPFLIVYGTSGSPEANERNKKTADQFAQEWFAFTRSRAKVKADKDVTGEEKQTKNLFLLGEEQENLLHAAAAKSLPFAVKDGQVAIAGKTQPLAGKGFMYVYPSPLRAAGSNAVVVVCVGLWYGRAVAPNHKFDLLPDFILYDDKVDADTTSTNRFLCAGFFDGEWKVDQKLMWWAEP